MVPLRNSLQCLSPSGTERYGKADMKIDNALKDLKKPCISFEFFPPSDDSELPAFYDVAEKLAGASPLFASVTYGAGGSKQGRTLSVAKALAGMGLTVMSHLTCVGASPLRLMNYMYDLREAGVNNILALRGDPPMDKPFSWDGPFRHASDLVSYIHRQQPDFSIGVAGYPCPHPESVSYEEDRSYLLRKIQAGGDFVVTQLFFDARSYFELVGWLRDHGCDCPVIPGILPIQSFKSLRRVLSMCGASIPARMFLELEDADRRGGNDEVRRVGIDYAVQQITRLLVGGAPGIHLYSLNKADLCLQIAREAGLV